MVTGLIITGIGIACTILGYILRTIYIEIPNLYATKIELLELKKDVAIITTRIEADIAYIRQRIDSALNRKGCD